MAREEAEATNEDPGVDAPEAGDTEAAQTEAAESEGSDTKASDTKASSPAKEIGPDRKMDK